jgi:Fe-Mn family superoxide dismutase
MAFELPELPYPKDALTGMSAETLDYHHGKHHKKYVDTLNSLVAGTPDESKSLEEIIKGSSGKLFNQAAQTWNHTFFWNCMSPDGGGEPTGDVAQKIDAAFGSYASFREQFSTEAANHFASGWAWLVEDGGSLKVVSTHDADTPVAHGQKPILTIDVWEHAYYIDYRNARPDFISSFLDNLVNWEFVAQNLSS